MYNNILQDKEKLLDEYIRKEFPLFISAVGSLTAEQRKAVEESIGFQRYQLANAWRKLLNEIKHCFPFNLLYRKSN